METLQPVQPLDLAAERAELGQALEDAALGVLRSGQYVLGPEVERFEQDFAASQGVDHGVGVASGTDALIVALRPYGNEVVLMVKGSAIASIVTVFDLMGETRRAFSRTFDFQTYIWAAIIYLIIVEVLRRVWDILEARLTRHLKRATEAESTENKKLAQSIADEELRNVKGT